MKRPVIALAIAGLAANAAALAAPIVADGSFEQPALRAGGYEYGVQNGAQHSSNGINARAAGVTFGNGAGVQSNGSAWNFTPAPAGRQTAFLQSYANQTPGRITLAVSGLTPGKSYAISFHCANRGGYDVAPVTVAFDRASLGSFTPGSTRWEKVTTASFMASTSKGTITLSVAPGSGDSDIGIDAVTVTSEDSAG